MQTETARTPRQTVVEALARYAPITAWLRTYPLEWLRPDVITGLVSWGVMVPVAMAYGQMAGLPPQAGLYTAFAAMAAYAIFGTSRHLKVTASSTVAVTSAAIVAPLAGGDAATFYALSAALALIAGAILIIAGVILSEDLTNIGIELMLAQVRGKVRDRLRTAGVMAKVGENGVYRSVAAGVEDYRERFAIAPPATAGPN